MRVGLGDGLGPDIKMELLNGNVLNQPFYPCDSIYLVASLSDSCPREPMQSEMKR